MSNKEEKFRPTANPEWAQAKREMQRSSKADPHDNRPKRIRTRQNEERAAKKDWED